MHECTPFAHDCLHARHITSTVHESVCQGHHNGINTCGILRGPGTISRASVLLKVTFVQQIACVLVATDTGNLHAIARIYNWNQEDKQIRSE